tara:strand:- start:2348 stop:3031 length:684 start_codon:yes stop_codon:yes gene_type:complete
MKAIILAAGLGSRLRPLTINTPKCLMPINNIPLIDLWIDKLEEINVKEVLINTHYHSEKVKKYLEKNKKNISINLTYEPKLLGTAGTLLKNIDFFLNEDLIFIHADNFMKESLSELCNAHVKRPKECLMTMLTFDTDQPETCGIVKLDRRGVVTSFSEKPSVFIGNLANGATYIISKEMLEKIRDMDVSDFSKEIIPKFIGNIYAYHTIDSYIDIGNLKSYTKAQSF